VSATYYLILSYDEIVSGQLIRFLLRFETKEKRDFDQFSRLGRPRWEGEFGDWAITGNGVFACANNGIYYGTWIFGRLK